MNDDVSVDYVDPDMSTILAELVAAGEGITASADQPEWLRWAEANQAARRALDSWVQIILAFPSVAALQEYNREMAKAKAAVPALAELLRAGRQARKRGASADWTAYMAAESVAEAVLTSPERSGLRGQAGGAVPGV